MFYSRVTRWTYHHDLSVQENLTSLKLGDELSRFGFFGGMFVLIDEIEDVLPSQVLKIGGERRRFVATRVKLKVSPIFANLSLPQPYCLMKTEAIRCISNAADLTNVSIPRVLFLVRVGVGRDFCWLLVELAIRESGAIKQLYHSFLLLFCFALTVTQLPFQTSSCLSQALFTTSTFGGMLISQQT